MGGESSRDATPKQLLKPRHMHVGQVAEGLGAAPSLVLGARDAKGLEETEAAVRTALTGPAAVCGHKRAPQSTARPPHKAGPHPCFPAPAPSQFPRPRSHSPPALASLLSARAHAPPQVLALRPRPSLPLSSENPHQPQVSPLAISFPWIPFLGFAPTPSACALPSPASRSRSPQRGGAGDGAPDRGVSALSTPRPLRAGTPKPFPAQHSRFLFQGVLLQP